MFVDNIQATKKCTVVAFLLSVSMPVIV